LPRFYGYYAIAFVAAWLVIIILVFSMIMNSTTSVSAVEANGVGVYRDSGCTDADEVFSIDWGTLVPGSVKNIPVYIRNEGEEAIYLTMSTTNWRPLEASHYMTFFWDYSVQWLSPGEAIQITLTLSVSRYIEGISRFSFDILVTGNDSLLGDMNGDGIVDSTDLGMIAYALGSTSGDPRYNPQCDVNNDGFIDFTDYGAVGLNWGQYY